MRFGAARRGRKPRPLEPASEPEMSPRRTDRPATTTQYWDGIASEWTGSAPTLWRTHSDAVNAALFARWLPSGRVERLFKTDLFDEAVGAGLYPVLATRARGVVGTDVSPEMARAAAANHPGLRALAGDVRHLPFAAHAFAVVVSNSTLDHFDSRAEIIASLHEIHRVLRQGGHLLLTLDNMSNPIIAARNALPFRLLNRLGLVPYQVGATYGPYGLKQIMRQTGFEVLDVAAMLHCPRVLAVGLTRLLDKRARSRTRARVLAALRAFELLAAWPTRFLTGYYVAVKAIKR